MKIALIGASGLIGDELMRLLFADLEMTAIISFVRRRAKIQSVKLDDRIINFDDLSKQKIPNDIDVAVCTLGTTMKKAKSKEAFKKVDCDYVVEFAKLCKLSGLKKFIVVSSIGADIKSKVFYSQVKGEMEQSLQKLGFENLIILRPSLLLGHRKEFRLFEKIGVFTSNFYAPFLFGPLRKFRPVKASKIAQIIHHFCYKEIQGEKIVDSLELQQIEI